MMLRKSGFQLFVGFSFAFLIVLLSHQVAAQSDLTFIGLGSDCSINRPPGFNPFSSMAAPAVSGQNTSDTQSKVAVGDVNFDGIPDAVITSKWNSEIRVVATKVQQQGAQTLSPGDIKSDFKTTGQGADLFKNIPNLSNACKPANLLFEHEVLIGDVVNVNAAQRAAEIFAIVSNRKGNPESPPDCYYLIGFTYQDDDLQVLPGYPIAVGTDRPGIPGLTDFDGDGKVELYLKNRIYAAENGKLLAEGTGNWDTEVNSAPSALDLNKSGNQEFICGDVIYNVPDLSNRNPATPLVLNSFYARLNDITGLPAAKKYFTKVYNDPVEYGIDNHSSTALGDGDNDGNIDVFISGAVNSNTGKTSVFYWNVAKQSVDVFSPVDPDPAKNLGWPWGTSRINMADADGDGKINVNFIAGNQLFSMRIDGSSTSPGGAAGFLISNWVSPRTINDTRSGVVTCTVYDFDNDGKPEMVYRDSQELVIIDGATGTNKLWSATCQSHTFTEGPIIADVNDDGSTDICVPCYRNSNPFSVTGGLQQQALGEIRLFFSSDNSWLPTRQVWNQPGYFVVNVNDDLSIPQQILDPNTVFSNDPCANGKTGPQKPLNMFINQVPTLGANGCPVFTAPDLTFFGDDLPDNPNDPIVDTNGDGIITPTAVVVPPICGNTDISVFFRLINSGNLQLSDVVPISFFNGDPRTDPAAVRLYNSTINITTLQVGDTLKSAVFAFNGPKEPFDLYIALYSDGATLPLVQTPISTGECKIDNNIYAVKVNPRPLTVEAIKLSDNRICSASDPSIGGAQAILKQGGTTVTDLSGYTFRWYANGTGTGTPISGQTSYNLLNVPAGTYSVIAQDKVLGCESGVASVQIVDDILTTSVSITAVGNQTKCSPPDGSLEATVVGGNNGYTFQWIYVDDQSILPTTGSTVSNLEAGAYQVKATRAGCAPIVSSQVTIIPPVFPTAGAFGSVIEDCSNLNTGSLTGQAFLNSVAQTTGFTYNWYLSNNGVRGSILPPANGTGANRTGLPVGTYELEVIDNATQCTATQLATVTSNLEIPVVTVVEVRPQTSCDPAVSNGKLKAEVSFNGSPVNLADYTFKWFEGDNTNTAVKATTQTITGVKSGTIYTAQAISKNNCSATDKRIVSQDLPAPVIDMTTSPNSVCTSGLNFTGQLVASVTFNGLPVSDFSQFTFTWYKGNAVVDPDSLITNPNAGNAGNAAQENIFPQRKSGFYTAFITNDTSKCVSAAITREVQDKRVLPVIEASAVGSVNCAPVPAVGAVGGVARVDKVDGNTPGVPYTFQWFSGSDTSTPVQPSASSGQSVLTDLQGSLTAQFTVEVINTDNGCRNTASVLVSDDSKLPQLALTSTPNDICDPALTNPARQLNGAVSVAITNLTGTETIADYEITWKAGSATIGTTPTVEQLKADTYAVTVRQPITGCSTGPQSIDVSDLTAPPLLTTAFTASTNCISPIVVGGVSGPGNGNVSVTESGTGPFSFQWTDFSGVPQGNSNSLNNLLGGPESIYTVLVTDLFNGCQSSTSVALPDEKEAPVVSVTTSPNSVCDPVLFGGNFTGSASATIANENPLTAYTYSWVKGTDPAVIGTSAALSNLEDATYTVKVVQDETGCESVPVSGTVLPVVILPQVSVTPVPSTNCISPVEVDGAPRNGNGSVTATVTQATDFTIEWYDAANVLIPVASNPTADQLELKYLQGGDNSLFTVRILNNQNGCVNTATALVSDDQVRPVVTLQKTDNDICDPLLATTAPSGQNYRGAIDLTLTNPLGSSTYEYSWTRDGDPLFSASTEDVTALNSGIYSVEVTQKETGCVSVPTSIQVQDFPVLPSLSTDFAASTNCASPVTVGTNTNAAGNGTAEVIVSGAINFTIKWSDKNGPISDAVNSTSDENILQFIKGSSSVADIYTATVVNTDNGCSNTAAVLVPENKIIPQFNITPQSNTVCDIAIATKFSGSATVNVTAPSAVVSDYTYTWTGGTPADPLTPNILNEIGPGTYSVKVRHNSTACETQPVFFDILDEPVLPLIAPLSLTPSTNCDPAKANGSLKVTTVNGSTDLSGFTFQWHNSSSPVSPLTGQTLNELVDVQGGSTRFYTVEVTSQTDGCQNTATERLPDNSQLPLVTLTSPQPNTICSLTKGAATPRSFDGILEAGISNIPAGESLADYQYSWTTPSGTVSTDGVPVINQRVDGTYSVVATSKTTGCVSDPANGAIASGEVNPTVATGTEPSKNCPTGTPDGEAFIVSPDAALFVYEWYNGSSATGTIRDTDDRYQGLQGGNGAIFAVDVTDRATGCNTVSTVLVADGSTLPNSIVVDTTPDTFCTVAAGTGSTSINQLVYRGNTFNTTTGFTGFTFNWTGAKTGSGTSFTNLDAGAYTLKVTNDKDKCVSDAVSVTVGTNFTFPPVVTTKLSAQTSCDPAVVLGRVGATVGGVLTDHTFVWRRGANFNTGTALTVTGTETLTTTGETFFFADKLAGGLFYTVRGTNNTTGCSKDETIFLPDERVFPLLTTTPTENLSCSPPDGAVEARVTNPETGAEYSYFWLKEASSQVSTDAATVISKVSTAPGAFDKLTVDAPDVDKITGIPYGDYTVVVLNEITKCRSQQKTTNVKDLRGNQPNADVTVFPGTCDPSSTASPGQMQISPSRLGSGFSEYSVEVYRGGPTNATLPIDFGTNPPVFPAGSQVFASAAPGSFFIVGNLSSDLYSIVVRDDFGCASITSKFIPFVDPHSVSYSVLNSTSCDDLNKPLGGVVGVFASSPTFPGANQTFFEFELYRGSDVSSPTGAFSYNLKNIIGASAANCSLNPGDPACSSYTQGGLSAGGYTLKVTETLTANRCVIYEPIEILNISAPPDLTAIPTANTNCISGFNGKLAVTVKKGAGDLNPNPTFYDIFSNTVLTSLSGVSENSTNNLINLSPGTYSITATDPLNSCTATKDFTIADSPLLPKLLAADVSIKGAEFCKLDDEETAGASVTNVRLGSSNDALNNYLYTWTTNLGSVLVNNAPANIPVVKKGGEEFFNSKGGGDILPTTGFITNGSYFVQVTKRPDAPDGGRNCTSAPLSILIPDNKVKPVVTLTGTSDTSCSTTVFEGTLTAKVTTASGIGAASNYDFDWTTPGSFPVPVDAFDQGGSPPVFTNMNDGTYSLIAKNRRTSCEGSKSVTILTSGKPVFAPVLTKKDLTRCDTFDGSVEVTSVTAKTSAGANLTPAPAFSDFTFAWTDAGTATTFTGTQLNLSSYPAIAVGKAYGVVATRANGSPGNGCASALVSATITDQKKFPVVTLTATDNTACDNAFDGSIKVAVATAGFPATTKYEYNWNDLGSSPPTAFPATSVFTSLQSAAPETFPVTFSSAGGQKLSDGVYTVRVKNDVNKCSSTGTVTMKKTTVDPVITSVTTLNKLKCTPDGSVTVGPIDIGTLTGVSHSEFDFTWFNGSITNPPLSLVLAPGTLPDVLNKTTLPGMGEGIYFVRVQRKSGLSPGSACVSLPFKAEVKDKSVKPVVQLTSLANSACGDQYNAEITVTPSTSGFPASTKYTYEWLTKPAESVFDSLVYNRTSPVILASGSTQLLRDGSYSFKVTNSVNECDVTGSVEVQQNIIPPVISSVTAIDQFNCAADGSVTVGSVEVGTTASVPPADFDYKWFRGSLSNPLTITPVAGNNVLNNTDLPATMGAGTYFVSVVRKRNTTGGQVVSQDCESAPLRADVLDRRVDPVVLLTSTNNTACDGSFDGSITAIATTTGYGDATKYRFVWTPPASSVFDNGGIFDPVTAPAGSPLTFLSSSTQRLGDGEYKVTVTNQENLCSTDANIFLEKKTILPEVVEILPTDRFLCAPDGSVRIGRIDFQAITNAPHSDFDFFWFRNNLSNAISLTTPSPTGADLLDKVSFPAITPDSYLVRVQRRPGILPGSACLSSPYRADIVDRSAKPVVILTSQPNTACDDLQADGKITIDASTPKFDPVTGSFGLYDPATTAYDYEWIDQPALTTFDPAGITSGFAPRLFESSLTQKLSDGVYKVKVTNKENLCATEASVVLEKNPFTPFISGLTAIDKLKCVPDGSITVGDIGFQGDPKTPHANFEFNWFRETTSTPVSLAVPLAGADVLNATSFPAIVPGKYLLKIVPIAGTGVGCSSVLYDATILDRTEIPVVAVSGEPNTACDGQFDGKLEVTASTNGFGINTKYRYEWAAPAGTVFDSLKFESVAPREFKSSNTQLIRDGDYTVTVTNLVNLCKRSADITLQRVTIPLVITKADATDQLTCLNDGTVFVSEIKVGGVIDPALTDYEYTWSEGLLSNEVAVKVPGLSTLDKTALPTIGPGNYFVKVTRKSGLAPASGCESQPVSVQISDLSVNPLADLTFTPNSTCEVTLPNGEIIATARELDNTVGTYTFAWTIDPNDPSAPAPVSSDVAASSTLSSATDGKYLVIARNTVTGCQTSAARTVTLDQSLSVPTILGYDLFKPTSCDGNGKITVKTVSIGGNTPQMGSDPAFRYEWSVVENSGPQVISGQSGSVLTPADAGTYLVRLIDNTTECVSDPSQVQLDQGVTKFPVVFIDLAARDITCTGAGSGVLTANVDGDPAPAAPFEFSWFNALDSKTNPVAGATTFRLPDLSSGDYSVAVKDTGNGCVTNAFFIVQDESPLGTPEASFNSSSVTDCASPNGQVTSNVIGLNNVIPGSKDYPFTTFDFSAELFNGTAAIGTPAEASMNQPVTGSFASVTNLNFGSFTVRITDNNTGCSDDVTGTLKDGRLLPEIIVREDNPQTSCLVNNGQISATADAQFNPLNQPGNPQVGQVSGYTFTWFAGSNAVPPAVGNNNILFGVPEGTYTVEVINNATSCKATKSGLIVRVNDVPAGDPEPVVLTDVSTCQPKLPPDGSATVSVGGETLGYQFSWYNGNTVSGTPVIGIDRINLDAGSYTVTASKLTSGCPGNPKTIEILDKRILPILQADIEPSYCSDTGRKPTGSILLTTKNPEAIIDDVKWVFVDREPDGTFVGESEIGNETGVQLFQQYPGFYRAEVATPQGCTGDLEVKIPSEIQTYNGVSQNNDNLNDGFIIDCISLFVNNNVKIYNRSGVKVYEADGYNNADVIFKGIGENGLYLQGRELPVGTYFYVIDKGDGSIPVAGYLELVR